MKIDEHKRRIRESKMRKLDIDSLKYGYKVQSANRVMIGKYLKQTGKEKYLRRIEANRKVRTWLSLAYAAKICKIIDQRRRVI